MFCLGQLCRSLGVHRPKRGRNLATSGHQSDTLANRAAWHRLAVHAAHHLFPDFSMIPKVVQFK